MRTGALKFGSFVLKSGRTALLFNAGSIHRGADLAELAACYAEGLLDSNFEVDVLFGPAYKGIPLAVSTSVLLAQEHGKSLGYCFNRKGGQGSWCRCWNSFSWNFAHPETRGAFG